jgi:molybdenum cofactor guanylyltransferase
VIDASDITGLVLAGGLGSRMGGVDKGLQLLRGVPMAEHALRRLQAQVGRTAINANRNIGVYEAMGAPVWPDALLDHPGPLAGFLAGLARCETPYLLTVPCDSPHFPADLAERLARSLAEQQADIAMAATVEDGAEQVQPVFCLLKQSLRGSLQAYIEGGQRKIDRWAALHHCVVVRFADAQAFANANTLRDLAALNGVEAAANGAGQA